MIRLYFYVEGQTERFYAETVLRDHLAGFGVMVEAAILAATRRRHGIVSRGGGRHYQPMKDDLLRLMRDNRGQDVRFTTMFDLYGLHSDFPGSDEARKLTHVPHRRVKKLEESLFDNVGDRRLVPHIQLHEFETILFCDLDAFEIQYQNCQKQVDALRADAGELVDRPELIDDGQHSAPSKRIAKYFVTYPSDKPTAPVNIATMIDLAVIRNRCPHFAQWLTTLESLDKEVN